METLELKCEVITPMFLSGANEKAELRVPSIKGVLRYWWRALNGHLSRQDLKKEEGNIFGSIESGNEKKSCVSIVINNKNLNNEPHLQEVSSSNLYIFDYLLYGVWNHRQNEKKYFNVSNTFDLVLNCQDSKVKNEVLKSLYVWNEYGGLGAKSRNGFGSIHISNLSEYTNNFSLSDLFSNQTLTPYTSFVKDKVKWFEFNQIFNTWDDALGTIGMAYREARLKIEPSHQYNKRQYIGAPIIIGKKLKSKLERHSKPYFLKVKKVGDKFKAGILFLPSLYIDGNIQEAKNFKDATDSMNQMLEDINNITMTTI